MLKALPNPRSSDTDTLSRVERKHAERELRHLNKEIDLVRALMYKNYERVRSLMDPGVYLTSCHLDKLLVRRQQLEQLTDKPPPVALLHCSLVV